MVTVIEISDILQESHFKFLTAFCLYNGKALKLVHILGDINVAYMIIYHPFNIQMRIIFGN